MKTFTFLLLACFATILSSVWAEEEKTGDLSISFEKKIKNPNHKLIISHFISLQVWVF